jgi:IS30 family transposase
MSKRFRRGYSQAQLNKAARQLNERPTLKYETPPEIYACVASTG